METIQIRYTNSNKQETEELPEDYWIFNKNKFNAYIFFYRNAETSYLFTETDHMYVSQQYKKEGWIEMLTFIAVFLFNSEITSFMRKRNLLKQYTSHQFLISKNLLKYLIIPSLCARLVTINVSRPQIQQHISKIMGKYDFDEYKFSSAYNKVIQQKEVIYRQ